MESQYFHMIGNLCFVLVFLAGAIYCLKRTKIGSSLSSKHINIINHSRIGSKEKLLLIEVNKTLLLIGATPNHIETLYIFDAKEDVIKESEFLNVLRSTNG
jgi:flagellar biosynthetic protein FliO